MTENFRHPAEKEARSAAIDIYRTLSVPRAEVGPHVDIWRELLKKTRSRFEKFKCSPADYERYIFVPQAYDRNNDEEVVFRTRIPSSNYLPTIEWRVLKKNSPATKELFTAVLSLINGEPKISLMQETLSIFIVKDFGIKNLVSGWVPKMETKTVVIEKGTDAYFGREELGKKVESSYIPIEEALAKISIPK